VRAEDAWNGLTDVRWLMLVTVILAVASPALHVAQRGRRASGDTSVLTAVLASVTAALVAYRVLIDLPDSSSVVDQKLGALIGAACAVGLAVVCWAAVRARRAGAMPETPARKLLG
jgi:hypothetical protein